LIDVHHPRLDPEVGYFILGEFDPHSDRAGRRGFSFDFDAIEVLNGYQDPARKSVDRMIDDWLGLLNHGHLATATGNSDTHHLTYNMGGYPRNYVRVRDDRPDHVTPQEVATSVKNHHAFFTTGPFVRVRSGQGDIGDLVSAPGGKASLDIEVDAAPWISVSRVILYVSGKEAKRWPVPESQDVSAFSRKPRDRPDSRRLRRARGRRQDHGPGRGRQPNLRRVPAGLDQSHLLRRKRQRPLRPRTRTRRALGPVRQNFNQLLATDPSRPAALLLGTIRQVCALVAPCQSGASSANQWPIFWRKALAVPFLAPARR
jgi:hypothetical protein